MLVIDGWDQVAAWEALAHGKLVYHCSSQCLSGYCEDLARALDEVSDLEYLLEIFNEEIRRALTRPNI